MTKNTIQARDFMSLTSRHMTDEGYLVAPGNMARTGVQEYRAYELGREVAVTTAGPGRRHARGVVSREREAP